MTERPVIIDIGYIIGGPEGHLLVEMLLGMFTAWAQRQDLAHDALEKTPAFGGGLKSAKLGIYCLDHDQFAAMHQGAHAMIRIPPDSYPQRRHMSCAGIRVSDRDDLPMPQQMADWGDERRRYFFDPYRSITDSQLGRLEIEPDMLFAGDFSALENA